MLSRNIHILAICLLSLQLSCGRNVLIQTEKKDNAEDALILLENDKAQEAIELLEPAVAASPEDYTTVSILASAYAQRYDVDMISIGLAMANRDSEASETESSGNSNSITAMFAVLPDPTVDNLNGLKRAIELLESIPDAKRTTSDNFKLVLLNTSLTSLLTKQFDKDGDGQMSPVELLELTDEAAITILTSIISAQIALAKGTGAAGDGSSSTVSNISSIQSEIDSQDGESDSEKLRNFLNKENQ